MKQDQYSRIDSIKVKARADYRCQICGSDFAVQAHAPNRDHNDWHNGVALCANCHADQHPDVPRGMFVAKQHQPYWHNISARELARRFGCHSRTVIRQAKKLNIPMNIELPDSDIERLRLSIRHTFRSYHKPDVKDIALKCPKCDSGSTERHGYNVTKKSGELERWRCQSCGVTFYENGQAVKKKVAEDAVCIDKGCPKCGHSHTIKYGFSPRRSGRIRLRKCVNCGSVYMANQVPNSNFGGG